MIMHRVQRRAVGEWHPKAQFASCFGWADLCVQHGFPIRFSHGPHPLADLRAPLQAAGQTDIDVAIPHRH